MTIKCFCANCGKPFEVYPSAIKRGGGKYCSPACVRIAQKAAPLIKKTCLVCGKNFYIMECRDKRGNGKYCSPKCSGLAQRKQIPLMCKNCGEEFKTCPSRFESKKFCSGKCQDEFEKSTHIEKTCVMCGKSFWEYRSHIRFGIDNGINVGKYCSTKCSNIARSMRKVPDDTKKKMSDRMSGKNNPMYGTISPHGKGRWFYGLEGTKIWMRSSYEYRIATILSRADIQWQYESKAFELDNGTTYRPDFYLPEHDLWLEVKGWMRSDARDKLERFAEQYPNETLKVLYENDIVNLEQNGDDINYALCQMSQK